MRHILLYKNGESDPAVMRELGCYERCFERALRAVGADDVRLEVHRGFEEPRHPLRHAEGPGAGGYAGLLLTGSPRSLVGVEAEPWMSDAQDFVREVARRGIPILGVCFGHQLLAGAFGGQVRQNPNGWEAGTRRVRLTAAGLADPLFAGLADADGWLTVNQSHRDEVGTAPADAVVLAGNERSAVQAMALGERVRSLQFHPEFDGEVTRRLVRSRAALLDEDARRHSRHPHEGAESLAAAVQDTPLSQRILANWLRSYVG